MNLEGDTMLDNLIFCLNATVPVLLLILLGTAFMKVGIFNSDFVKKINSFVFKIALPILLFNDLSTENFYDVWDSDYVLFCFVATALSIGFLTLLSFMLKDKSLQGEFIQSSYRSSAALLGITIAQNLYGSSKMMPLMIIGAVPLYNIAAVIILSVFKPEAASIKKDVFKSTLLAIIKNPLILGIFFGLSWSLLQIPVPTPLDNVLSSLGRLATPMGLMAMGASFKIKSICSTIKQSVTASFIKLFVLTMLILPFAICLGFRNHMLVGILIMSGSPTTVSSFVMAKNMGHDGSLTSNAVMISTLFSSFSLTLWLFLLKSYHLL